MTSYVILESIVFVGLLGFLVMLISVFLSCSVCGTAWAIQILNDKIRGRDA